MISLEEVKKMAMLARIEMDKKEAEELQNDLGAILDYVGQLKKAPPATLRPPATLCVAMRAGVARRAGPSSSSEEFETSKTPTNVFREDEPVKDESEIKKGEHIKVKHILEN
jgi:aspartyl/glutamyl-tRNA(Asn/Gln) amidotransferase C subunit